MLIIIPLKLHLIKENLRMKNGLIKENTRYITSVTSIVHNFQLSSKTSRLILNLKPISVSSVGLAVASQL
jgi:hypothetical protein